MKRKWFKFMLPLTLMLMMVFPAGAAEYVADVAGVLSEQECAQLEQQAAGISAQRNCGVYIVTLDSYLDYGSDVYDVTTDIYYSNQLGVGADRDGAILLLSMDEREYAMFFHGDFSEYAFDAYGQEQLEGFFLDDFAEDEWYEGFADYLEACDDYLAQAQAGEPVRESSAGYVGIAWIAAFIIAFVVCKILKGQMKSVRVKEEANEYVADSGLVLTVQRDQFITRTVSRTKVKSESSGSSGSSGGSRARSGGGGSGRSGKF